MRSNFAIYKVQSGPQDDGNANVLAQTLIGHTEDTEVGNRPVTISSRSDFGARDVLSAAELKANIATFVKVHNQNSNYRRNRLLLV